MKNYPRSSELNVMKIHFFGAGDIILSLGTRYHIGQLLTHIQRRATLASFSFFQFRSAGTPSPGADGRIAVNGFPFKVYCPTGAQQYLRLPRPMFRFIERLRLWNFFRRKINAVKPGEKLMYHGCLGAVTFLCRRRHPRSGQNVAETGAARRGEPSRNEVLLQEKNRTVECSHVRQAGRGFQKDA